jgi:hypothetical protein
MKADTRNAILGMVGIVAAACVVLALISFVKARQRWYAREVALFEKRAASPFAQYVAVSPNGRLAAFTLTTVVRLYSEPVLVVDLGSGTIVARTEPSAAQKENDSPVDWFPDGGHVLCRRYSGITKGGNAFVLELNTGATKPVGLPGSPYIHPERTIGPHEFLYNGTTAREGGQAGLCIAREAEGLWQPAQLVLPERPEDGSWALPKDREGPAGRFLSSGTEEASIRMIVWDGDWLCVVTIAEDGSLAWQRICPVYEAGCTHALSPDGEWLCLSLPCPDGEYGPDRFYLLPARPGATLPAPPQLEHDVFWRSFSPSSDKLLLWKGGFWPDPGQKASDYPPTLGGCGRRLPARNVPGRSFVARQDRRRSLALG